MAQAQEIIVYSTDFESFNSRLTANRPRELGHKRSKLRGSPAGESDGLARLQLPSDISSRAGYVGGLYRAAYPPGRTNVMLWPEISGLGSTLKFEVQMLLQRSDENGIYIRG